ncbi:MAG TPA: cupin domain-containing protein [Gemmatimonadales bacterium]|nr:cupin domain-containing protein [Gemmatimonadales bacterium]
MRSILVALILTFSATMVAAQGTPSHGAQHAVVVLPEQVAWKPGPPSLPSGAKFAVIEGNPSEPGPFTMRLSLPNGYRIPVHSHAGVEHVTVLKGTFRVGMGDKFDESALAPMPTGSFAALAPGTRHFAQAQGETTLQLHGVGPWSVTYVNPAEDPRKQTP